MERTHATGPQRVGIFLAAFEAALFWFVAALHFGFEVQLGQARFAAPFLYPAAITETLVGAALWIAALWPGTGQMRAARVLAAQILTMLAMFALQIALLRGVGLITARSETFYAVAAVLTIASIVLVASPMYRTRHFAR